MSHRCSKCDLPCGIYASRTRVFGLVYFSLCCKAKVLLYRQRNLMQYSVLKTAEQSSSWTMRPRLSAASLMVSPIDSMTVLS